MQGLGCRSILGEFKEVTVAEWSRGKKLGQIDGEG